MPLPKQSGLIFDYVLDLLRQGGSDDKSTVGPPLDTTLFNMPGDGTQAVILTPRKWRSEHDPSSQQHPTRVEAL
jgi:hypothetical protein